MRSEGGGDEEENLITLCSTCHDKMHLRLTRRTYSQSELSKAGIARARASGTRWGPRTYHDKLPEAVALAKKLRKKKLSLRQISKELFDQGFKGRKGQPIPHTVIERLTRGLIQVTQGQRTDLED
jgi:hypothetical protein